MMQSGLVSVRTNPTSIGGKGVSVKAKQLKFDYEFSADIPEDEKSTSEEDGPKLINRKKKKKHTIKDLKEKGGKKG
jgi:hypothetical protein